MHFGIHFRSTLLVLRWLTAQVDIYPARGLSLDERQEGVNIDNSNWEAAGAPGTGAPR
jgi:hypothetical protein